MFAGPNPWMHYKYDKYSPYNLDEAQHHDTASSSRSMNHDNEKTKSSTHPIRKEVKTEAKHVKSNKPTTWVKTKEVAEHVKDGIAKSVELTLESVAFCVKAGGGDSTDVVGDGKITTIKKNDDSDNTESDVHGVFDADTKTWDDIKAKIDFTLKQSKEYPGVDLDANKACHSGFAGHRDDKRKKSINADEKARVDRELKNIAHCILGNFDDAAANKWDDIKGRTDAILENSKKSPAVDKGFEDTTDLGENAIQQEKDPTISLTEKGIDSANRDLAAIWKIEEKFEITEEDIVGSGPDKVNFVIKGGFKTIHATMPDVSQVRREAIAATAWNPVVHLLDQDIPNDKDVGSIAEHNKDLDAIVGDLRCV